MRLSEKQLEFESYSRQIIGLRLSLVEYYEVNYKPDDPQPLNKTKFTEIDTVDYSIILHCDNNRIEITWDGQFYQYGIGIKVNEKPVFDNYQSWNVSQSENWRDLIGEKIIDLKFTWEIVRTLGKNSGEKEEFIYPQHLTLLFSNNKKIFVSAAGFLKPEDNEVYGLLDNLTVTNNEHIARKVKMI